jgi:anti-sigma regulatory factor (Ser/Thr protein kinase)
VPFPADGRGFRSIGKVARHGQEPPVPDRAATPGEETGVRAPAGTAVTAAARTATPANGTAPPGGPAADGRPEAADVVLTLQRQLLPASVPIFPQVRIGASYLAAPEESRAGAGWFDVFALPGGVIALMAGEAAAGRGPAAVAGTSELRRVMRDALMEGAAPLAALSHLDAFAARFPATRGATLCLGLLDSVSGAIRYASAGQPMPLVCAPAGRASFLAPARGGPLGVGAEPAAIASAVLAPETALLLCFDGLAGPPGVPARRGPERFTAAVTSAFAAEDGQDASFADDMCQAVADRLAGYRHGGDVTVVTAYRLAERAPGWSLELPAEPLALRHLRARVRAWLGELGATPRDCEDTELAVYEAAANAVVHGQPADGPGQVTVQTGFDGTGGVVIAVTDRGRWRPGASPDLAGRRSGGRGLSVISKVTDELSISPGPTGTTVTMRRALSHPVTVGRALAPGGDQPS